MNFTENASQGLLKQNHYFKNYNSIHNSQQTSNHNKPTFIRFKGILLGLLAAFFFALFGGLNRMAIFVTASEQSSMRYLMQIVIMICIAKYNKENILGPREQCKLLLIRGIFGAISFISMGFSLRYIEPADSQALYNTRLVIIPILALVFLKENLKISHIVAFILTIAGVILICEQSFLMSISMGMINCTDNNNNTKEDELKKSTQSHYIGVSLGLVAALAASCVSILLKKLATLNVHYSISVIFSSYIGCPIALLISLIMFLTNARDVNSREATNTPTKLALQIFFSFSSAMCGCLNQLLVAMANKYETANVLALVSTTSLFWSFLFDFLFLSNGDCISFFNVYNLVGASLIFLAAVLSLVVKIFEEKNK